MNKTPVEVKEPENETTVVETKVEEPKEENDKEKADDEETSKGEESKAEETTTEEAQTEESKTEEATPVVPTPEPEEPTPEAATPEEAKPEAATPEEAKPEETTADNNDVKPPSAKKAKSDSKEGPMGELRPSDVLAGNYRKRAGNYLFKKMLREIAPDVGKVEMRILVAKIFDGIAGQEPPGRFIREGGDALLSRAQTNQKIARALREVKERSEKDPNDKSAEKPKKPKAVSVEKEEMVGEIRSSDVLTGNYRKRPGNFLYKKLLRENAPSVATEEMRAVVTRVIEGIYGQEPPGRFIREGGGGLLTRGQVHQKVARALREVVERTKEGAKIEGGEAKVVVKKKATPSEKQEPMGEVRPSDVLTGNYRKRAGNALYKKLLREHAPAVGKEEMGLVVSKVIDGIGGQEPPGRFIREGGGALLTRGQVRQKVARALREVVERTKNPNKDKEEREARKEAAAKKAAIESEAKGEPVVKADDKEETKEEPAAKEEVPKDDDSKVVEAEKKEEEVVSKDDAKMEETKEEEEPEKKEEPAEKEEEEKKESPAAALAEKKDSKKEEPEKKEDKKPNKEEAKEEEAKEEPKTRKTRRQETKEEEPKPAKRTRKR